jgi:hypothetical protein
MSGHADFTALILRSDRGQFGSIRLAKALQETAPESAGGTPSPLDFYGSAQESEKLMDLRDFRVAGFPVFSTA